MDDTAESQLQGLNLQGVKQTNGVEYMNGDGMNSPQKMDDFEAQFQPVPAGKAASGLDPNASPFEPFGHHSDLLGLETSDQTVPSGENMAAAPDPQPPANDGVLIDFSGKDQASSPLPPSKDAPAANGVTSPASGTDEEKAGKRTPSASSKKKYGIDSKNMSYKPGGGQVKIFDQKVQVKASPRVNAGAKTPPGSSTSPRKESPRPKPTTPKGPAPNVKNVTSKIGSLQNATYTPGGGQVKIASKKKDYSTVTSKVGSTANMDHRPGGGEKKTGVKKIESHKVEVKAHSKVGSTDYMSHKPGGGQKKIETQKLDFKDKAKPKVESKTNHKPGGGDKKIETQKLNFKDGAKSLTDSGTATPKVRTESANSQDSAN